MKILGKIIKLLLNIITIFMIALVIFAVSDFVQVKILKKSYPEFFGYTFFEIQTGSMAGTIEISDIIIVEITQDVHKDDIITFEKEEQIITHRIIKEREEDKLVTKGDANNGEDDPIERNQVIGKVVRVIPELGVWFKVFSDLKVVLSIIVTIILLSLALPNKKEKRNRRNRHKRGMKRNVEEEEKKD